MFTPVPMLRVDLRLLTDDAPRGALALAVCAQFDPEVSEVPPDQLPELPGEAYRLVYAEAQARLDKILAHYEITDIAPVATHAEPENLARIEELGAWLKNMWEQCSEDQEGVRRLREELRRTQQLLQALDRFMDLNIDLTLLQKKSAFLDLRVGTLPRANVQRFEDALSLAGYVSIHFLMGPEQAHMIIAGPTGHEQEVERVLQAAGWHADDIPPEFRGRPAEVRAALTARAQQLQTNAAELDERRRVQGAQDPFRTRLLDAAHTLARVAPYAALAQLMRSRGSLAVVSGWVPAGQLPRLRRLLSASLGARYVLLTRTPRADERPRVPSLLRHHRWLRPCAALVQNYGVPRYGEIDPTLLFAVSFVLMFGMMFGDLGHGAVIVVAGIALRRRLQGYTPLVVAAGAASMGFGLLYGSIFGYEHVIPAWWMSPLSDPMRMLGVALAWGIGFIVIATALTIRNRLAEDRWHAALWDGHGAAGLVLYLGLLFAAYRYASAGAVDIGAQLGVGLPLAVVLVHIWQENSAASRGERVLIVMVEGFETVVSYISNTLSFLRVAAFSLNHVALAIAVFTLGRMMHATGYWLTVVLGNVFILVLEGAIVAIQALRLEYYEGFSRFFSGDGRAFRPLTLPYGRASALKPDGQ
jgi:V/A-type H+/Na+-transporting ATPase subunit I